MSNARFRDWVKQGSLPHKSFFALFLFVFCSSALASFQPCDYRVVFIIQRRKASTWEAFLIWKCSGVISLTAANHLEFLISNNMISPAPSSRTMLALTKRCSGLFRKTSSIFVSVRPLAFAYGKRENAPSSRTVLALTKRCSGSCRQPLCRDDGFCRFPRRRGAPCRQCRPRSWGSSRTDDRCFRRRLRRLSDRSRSRNL